MIQRLTGAELEASIVSIRTRPEERVILADDEGQAVGLQVSIRTRPEERVIHTSQNGVEALYNVSIRTRPEERVIRIKITKHTSSCKRFQSAPAPKSG